MADSEHVGQNKSKRINRCTDEQSGRMGETGQQAVKQNERDSETQNMWKWHSSKPFDRLPLHVFNCGSYLWLPRIRSLIYEKRFKRKRSKRSTLEDNEKWYNNPLNREAAICATSVFWKCNKNCGIHSFTNDNVTLQISTTSTCGSNEIARDKRCKHLGNTSKTTHLMCGILFLILIFLNFSCESWQKC